MQQSVLGFHVSGKKNSGEIRLTHCGKTSGHDPHAVFQDGPDPHTDGLPCDVVTIKACNHVDSNDGYATYTVYKRVSHGLKKHLSNGDRKAYNEPNKKIPVRVIF